VVLASVVIGDDVVVGAGSVVNANLQEPGTYVGIPARKI
jgi:serine acetyltransferase